MEDDEPQKKSLMLDSDGSEVHSFDSGRNFTVLKKPETKNESNLNNSIG
jgi:hypothetical protein